MVKLLNQTGNSESAQMHDLIHDNEIIVIVEDSPEIALLLSSYLKHQNLPHEIATCAAELSPIIQQKNVALILLDIGLPDADGTEILKDLASQYPDLGIIMVTGTTDLQIALKCLREGADDYLTKPVDIRNFYRTVHEILHKRRLAIDNRLFQQQLEATNVRTQFLHELNLKMNGAYLNTVELEGVLHAILVGITSQEGLTFNRAFLALFDEDSTILHGRLAIGPARREDANRVWNEIRSKKLRLQDIINDISSGKINQDIEINQVIEKLEIPLSDREHILIRSCMERVSIHVQNGTANGFHVDPGLLSLLDESSFIIIPLYSPSTSLGVIIADNFVTGKQITSDDINSLEIFASQASLAIEHSELYRQMSTKINELELATKEIERSKDLLIKAEKLSTLGHMSAQVVHSIRNPITALGGTARLLAKKNHDADLSQFIQVIIKEADKIETTLEDLFNYVDEGKLHKEECAINQLAHQSVMVFYATLQKNKIETRFYLDESDPVISVDINRIKQVFHHLIKNSIEAMDNGGTLTVQTHLLDTELLINFTDTGRGIDNDSIGKASDAFFTTKTYGTGMGLTIVEQIISQHGAAFCFQQNITGGMEAIISFPR